ncbi:MAG: metallophosphoesterase [Clostridia bacterium]|nr:metallophosphoesterase [Clostridia bacterium]
MRKERALFQEKEKEKVSGCLVYPLLLVLAAAVIIALNLINSGRVLLDKQDVTVPSLSSDLEKYRILHISDLHGNEFGADHSTLSNLLKGSSYRAVCITGDVCGRDGSYDAFLKLLDIFPAEIPVFFIAGDEDPEPILTASHGSDSVKADYILAAEAKGAIYLDAPYKLTVGKSVIWFSPESVYGLDIDSSRAAYQSRRDQLTKGQEQYLPDNAAQIRAIDYRLDVLSRIEAARREMKPVDAQIALTHHPLTGETLNLLQQWAGSAEGNFLRNVSLILAGHYNAGQVRVPLIGALRAPASAGGKWLPGDEAIVGLNTIHGVTQYISPGLGVSRDYLIPLRIFNTPSITLITLTSRLTV